MSLSIFPLDLGTLTVDRSGLTLRKDIGIRLAIPCLGWLILGGTEPVLVDTGPSEDVGWGSRNHNPFTRTSKQSLVSQLWKHGVAPHEIRTVILTHLHWDHCYGNHLLPNARFIVQRRELDYANNPLDCDRPIYETDIAQPPFLVSSDRFDLVEGDTEVFGGIGTVLLPGHSPGLQGVLVRTATANILLGSDHFPLFENIEGNIPTGIVQSLPDWYAASARARSLCDYILPGHDSRVLERERYP